MRLDALKFTGPNKPDAEVTFTEGVNVIYGASETGKSFIVDTVDFMLGGGSDLRDIREAVGYDRILLRWQIEEDSVTFARALIGGDYLALEQGEEKSDLALKARASGERTNTLSANLLSRLAIFPKKIRRNAAGDLNIFSIRDLARLVVVTDEDIYKTGSPYTQGQHVTQTVDYSALKLLLTGVDDSAIVSVPKDVASLNLRTEGKIELLDEMIERLEAEIENDGAIGFDEAVEQFERVEATLARRRRALSSTREEITGVEDARREAYGEAVRRKRRIDEILELDARFALLDEHYANDLARLEAVQETGAYFSALAAEACPLCGADPKHHRSEIGCGGDTDLIAAAANAEIQKIEQLRRDLHKTASDLEAEKDRLNGEYEEFRLEVAQYDAQLKGELTSNASSLQSAFQEAIDARTSARTVLARYERLEDLKNQRVKLARKDEETEKQERAATTISKSVLDELSQTFLSILQAWDFPSANRVHFDERARDFVIDGKPRGSSGRGLRAVTHAAAIIALLEYCLERELPHPGFVVMDSPLLAYFEPEGEEDDLRGTDLKRRFYEYLIQSHARSQIIIIENTPPPDDLLGQMTTTIFTKNPHSGRYGLFPTSD